MKRYNIPKAIRKLAALATPLIAGLMVVGCEAMYNCEPTDSLRVAMAHECGGQHHAIGGERYCMAADLTDSLAQRLALHHTFLPTPQPIGSLAEGLAEGRIDVAVVPEPLRTALHRYPSLSPYATRYALLLPKSKAPKLPANSTPINNQTFLELCRGRSVCSGWMPMAAEVKGVAKSLCDTLPSGLLAAQQLLKGGCEAVVCEVSEARLLQAAYPSLKIAALWEEKMPIRLIFRNQTIKAQAEEQLQELLHTDSYYLMREVYTGSEPLGKYFGALGYKPTRVVDGISVWDAVIRQAAEKEGIDWRLMSAMAYHESRFRNTLSSNRGACGLMQVTPIVAQEFNMPEADLFDPATNTLLAAKLIAANSRALGLGTFPTTTDGIAIVVASYHCGITRTKEAQRLTERYGGNPHSWTDLRQTMAQMGDPTSSLRRESRVGLFRDHNVTATYTNRVVALYKTFLLGVAQ